jgi:membrane protease YdiL (CAAX protease family)
VNDSPEITRDAESTVSASPNALPELSATADNNPDNPPWGILAALITWFVSIAMLAIVPNVCVLPYLAYRYAGTQPTRDLLLKDQTFVFLFVIGWLPAHLLTLALVWAIGTRLGKRSFKQVFGWSWSPNFGLWRSSALAITLFVVTLVLIGVFGGPRTDLDRILESSRATAVTLAIIAVVTAPLVEELIYRGLLYSALQRFMALVAAVVGTRVFRYDINSSLQSIIGKTSAVVIVASMFAGLHVVQYWPNVGAISSITLLSAVLTLTRARTGRLLPCFVVHLVFNGVQSIIIIIEPYLRTLLEHWRHEPVNGFILHISHLLS